MPRDSKDPSSPRFLPVTIGGKSRHEEVMACMPTFDKLIQQVIARDGLATSQFVAVWIVVESPWQHVAERLMPGMVHDWHALIAQGEKPIAQGIVKPSITRVVANVLPSISPEILSPVPPDRAKLLALDGNGCTVYLIDAPGAKVLN